MVRDLLLAVTLVPISVVLLHLVCTAGFGQSWYLLDPFSDYISGRFSGLKIRNVMIRSAKIYLFFHDSTVLLIVSSSYLGQDTCSLYLFVASVRIFMSLIYKA